MINRTTTALRTLTFDELEMVSGAKPKVVDVIVERCVSRYEGGRKHSSCVQVSAPKK